LICGQSSEAADQGEIADELEETLVGALIPAKSP